MSTSYRVLDELDLRIDAEESSSRVRLRLSGGPEGGLLTELGEAPGAVAATTPRLDAGELVEIAMELLKVASYLDGADRLLDHVNEFSERRQDREYYWSLLELIGRPGPL